jgi:hypothetical protein
MPVDYEIRDGVAWVRARGVLVDADLLVNGEQLAADPRYAQVTRDLFDASEVTSMELTGRGVQALAELLRSGPHQSTRVAIVTNSLLAFGMGRMYELLRHEIDVMVFEDREKALQWLLA